jgi:hypothetical protein
LVPEMTSEMEGSDCRPEGSSSEDLRVSEEIMAVEMLAAELEGEGWWDAGFEVEG